MNPVTAAAIVDAPVTVNAEQRLYVIREGAGWSCLGFDVAERRRAAFAGWLGMMNRRAPVPALGTLAHYEAYKATLDHVLAVCRDTGKRCDVELTPQLIGLEGQRVEVVDCDGERRRFIVGKSTGPVPIHLEIKTRRSSGGGAVMGAPFQSVRTV